MYAAAVLCMQKKNLYLLIYAPTGHFISYTWAAACLSK